MWLDRLLRKINLVRIYKVEQIIAAETDDCDNWKTFTKKQKEAFKCGLQTVREDFDTAIMDWE